MKIGKVQREILDYLRERGGEAAVGQIACDSNHMEVTLNRLRDRGLIERVSDEGRFGRWKLTGEQNPGVRIRKLKS